MDEKIVQPPKPLARATPEASRTLAKSRWFYASPAATLVIDEDCGSECAHPGGAASRKATLSRLCMVCWKARRRQCYAEEVLVEQRLWCSRSRSARRHTHKRPMRRREPNLGPIRAHRACVACARLLVLACVGGHL